MDAVEGIVGETERMNKSKAGVVDDYRRQQELELCTNGATGSGQAPRPAMLPRPDRY
jgi:hypothetical protein